MDQVAEAPCPRCGHGLTVTLRSPQYAPCLECPCKALVEVRMVQSDGEYVGFTTAVIGNWSIVHTLYNPPRPGGALLTHLKRELAP